jgi:hypothetical protein
LKRIRKADFCIKYTIMNSKNAFWIGMALAVLQAISALATIEPFTFYALVFPIVAAIMTYLGKNRQGPVWSVLSQVGANLTSFYAAHPTPEGLTPNYVVFAWLIPLAILALGIFGQKAPDQPSNN